MNVHIDAELAESIIQLNSLLDSMWGIAKKVLACAAVVAMAAAAVVAYLGPLVSQRPGEFTLLVLLVLAVGLLAGYGTAMIRWRGTIDSQISLRDDKISELEESAATDAARIAELMASAAKDAARIAELESRNGMLASQLGAITDSVTEEFMGQVPFLKLMAMDAYDRGGIDDPHDFLFDQICDDDLLHVASGLFLQDSLVPEGTRWVLRQEVRASIDEKPELLDSARRARERGEEGDYAMFTVLDGTVARDEKMYKERMGFVF